MGEEAYKPLNQASPSHHSLHVHVWKSSSDCKNHTISYHKGNKNYWIITFFPFTMNLSLVYASCTSFNLIFSFAPKSLSNIELGVDHASHMAWSSRSQTLSRWQVHTRSSRIATSCRLSWKIVMWGRSPDSALPGGTPRNAAFCRCEWWSHPAG